MERNLTCFKCWKETAMLTYEENRVYKVSCKCGCEYTFDHCSMADAVLYHNKMLELYGEINNNKALRAENARLQAELDAKTKRANEAEKGKADPSENIVLTIDEWILRTYQAERNYDHWKKECLNTRAERNAAIQILDEQCTCTACKHSDYCEGSCGGGGSCSYEYAFEWRGLGEQQ